MKSSLKTESDREKKKKKSMYNFAPWDLTIDGKLMIMP